MDTEQRTDMIHNLDLKYQQSRHQSDMVVKDEEVRRINLRSLLVRDENAALKDQLGQRDGRIKDLSAQRDDVRGELDSASRKTALQEKKLQMQARELSTLKEELQSLSGTHHESAKFLTEKLALSRELAILKPELEHLRSQLATQAEILGDKLALERQLNAMEVELANEKRATRKAAHKQDRDSSEEESLRKQVQDLEGQLAQEKRQNESTARDNDGEEDTAQDELRELREKLIRCEKELAAEKKASRQTAKTKRNETEEELRQLRETLAETQKLLAAEKKRSQRIQAKEDSDDDSAAEEASHLREQLAAAKQEAQRMADKAAEQQQDLEAKLEAALAKLRESKQELKQCQAELEVARQQGSTVTTAIVTTEKVPIKKAAAKAPLRKKRRANEMEADDMKIHTPNKGDDRPKRALKKSIFEPSVPGEKSTFSITPFLNRTVNITDISSPKSVTENATTTLPVFQFRGVVDDTTTALGVEPIEETAIKPLAKKSVVKLQPKKTRGRPPKAKPLGEASSAKKNTPVGVAKSLARPEPILEKVLEETDEPSQDQENRPVLATTKAAGTPSLSFNADKSRSSTSSTSVSEIEPKKKKRKILGGANKPTLFEDEDAERETTKKAPKAVAGGAVRSLGKVAIGKRDPFAGKTFSPLKRDRRGVNASFLA